MNEQIKIKADRLTKVYHCRRCGKDYTELHDLPYTYCHESEEDVPACPECHTVIKGEKRYDFELDFSHYTLKIKACCKDCNLDVHELQKLYCDFCHQIFGGIQ